MTAATPIAAMVEHLFAAGAAPEAIVRAVAAESARPRRLPAPRAAETRGTRLPPAWTPSEVCVHFALNRGVTRERVAMDTEKFRNYGVANSGRDATKRDWDATWRNWCSKSMEMRHGLTNDNRSHSATQPAQTGADAVLAGMGRVARRIIENRNGARPGDRQTSSSPHIALQLDLKCERA
jgi:hypothetical protein